LGFGTHSEVIGTIALQVGLAACALTLVLTVVIFWVRMSLTITERREKKFQEDWRPIMVQSTETAPEQLPPLARSEWISFLSLWNYFQESLLGGSKQNLNRLARECAMDVAAKKLLETGNIRERLLAILALGHLREKSAWRALRHVVTSSDPVLSLAAARAIVQIDAHAAMPLLVPQICTREEWSPSKVAGILREAGVEVISRPLAAAAMYAAPRTLPRLIRYLNMVPSAIADPVIGQIIQASTDEQVIAACLEAMKDPVHLATIRSFAGHPDWHVRMAAAGALGRLGTDRDGRILVDMLDDNEWWVSRHAAQSLARMPFVTAKKLRRIGDGLKSEPAKRMLNLVIEENESS